MWCKAAESDRIGALHGIQCSLVTRCRHHASQIGADPSLNGKGIP